MAAKRPNPVSERVCSALTRGLNHCTRSLLPLEKLCWGEALIIEQQQIETPKERLMWAAGGAYMTAIELLKKAGTDRWTWFTAFLLGIVSAIVDLHSANRWPHIFLLFCSALLLALWRPKWAWRWALAVGLCLPTFVLLTRDWGPYAVDQFDVFYGIVPAAVGTICGAAMRRISDWLNKRALTR
jgi:hypothetical protein